MNPGIRRFLATAALAGLSLAATAVSAPTLQGEWEFTPEGSSDINDAIEGAVAKMNFIKRPIARSRLKKTNAAYRKISILRTAESIVVGFDGGKPVHMPASGATVKWKREDGETFDVSGTWQDARVTQKFVAEDGSRQNVFRLNETGDAVTLEVTLTSDQLPTPLTYALSYRRAR